MGTMLWIHLYREFFSFFALLLRATYYAPPMDALPVAFVRRFHRRLLLDVSRGFGNNRYCQAIAIAFPVCCSQSDLAFWFCRVSSHGKLFGLAAQAPPFRSNSVYLRKKNIPRPLYTDSTRRGLLQRFKNRLQSAGIYPPRLRVVCKQGLHQSKSRFFTLRGIFKVQNERWFILLELRPGFRGSCFPARIRLCRPRDTSGVSRGQHRAALRTVFYSGSPSSSAIHAAVCTAS